MLYPLGLRLNGRKVVVVGAGNVAHRRVPRLLDAGARVLLVAPWARDSLRAMAEGDNGRLRWVEREFVPADLDSAWLVLAATDDPQTNAEVSRLAEEARVFCVRADDRDAATAWTPAVSRHDELVIASFAGGDPRRSAALRDRLAELADGGQLNPPRYRRRSGVPGVALVGAGPGDPGLITIDGRAALAEADVVIADRLAPARLLEELRDDTELIDAAKIPYGRQLGQDEILALMLERARAGAFVVRLKGGDGFVFGRGGEELDACAAAGIPVRVVPGVTSAVAGPALAAIPVTERGLVHEFTIVSGHVPPGDPTGLTDWGALARLRGTLVVLMGVKHRGAIAAALMAGGRSPATPVAAVVDASTPRQRELRSSLAELGGLELDSPAVIVVGDVARPRRGLRPAQVQPGTLRGITSPAS